MATVSAVSTTIERVSSGLPYGRWTPRGTLRWYLVCTPQGAEVATCSKVRKIVGPDVLEDAFVMFKERWFHREGVWSLRRTQLWREYFFVATCDVVLLDRALRHLSFPARIAGTDGHAFAPLDMEAQAWFSRALDRSYVLRNSIATILDGVLHVESGPLVGQERHIFKVNRHKRTCLVRVCDGDGGFVIQMPIDIPFKS